VSTALAWSIIAAVCALAVLAGALRGRAVLPVVSAAASFVAAWLAPPLLAFACVLISLTLLVLGRVVWRLLDDGGGP
jgi:hypothetical protein